MELKLNQKPMIPEKQYALAKKIKGDGTRATVLLGLAMALSGTVGFFALGTGQTTANIVFFRCLFGALSLTLWCLWRGSFNGLKSVERKAVYLIVLSGIFLVLNWAALIHSFSYISISLSTIIYHLQPFWIVLFGALFLGEKLTSNKIFWLLLAFSGLILIVWPNIKGASLSTAWLVGIMFATLASLFYAGLVIVVREIKTVEPSALAVIHCVIGTLLFAPFVSTGTVLSISSAGLVCLVSLGVIHTALVSLLLYSNYSKVPTATIGVTAFLNPVTALIVDYLFYGTAINLLQMLGVISILVGGLGITMNWLCRAKLSELRNTVM